MNEEPDEFKIHATQATSRQQGRPYIPPEVWNQLPREAQFILMGRDGPVKPLQEEGKTSVKMNVHATTAHDTVVSSSEDPLDGFYDATSESSDHDKASESTALLAHVTKQQQLPPGDVRHLISQTHKKPVPLKGVQTPQETSRLAASKQEKKVIIVDGKKYVQAVHKVQYQIDSMTSVEAEASLVDRGANGSMAGADVRLLEKTAKFTDITGINDHCIEGLPVGTVAGVVQSQHGPVCAIMHQYAYKGTGKSIHSSVQIEHFGNEVNDKSNKLRGGKQRIVTVDGYVLPLQIRNGLPYLDMHSPTDHELETLPHVVLTSDEDWNPSCLDSELEDMDEWFNAQEDLPQPKAYGEHNFDRQGYYRGCHIASMSIKEIDDFLSEDMSDIVESVEVHYVLQQMQYTEKDPDYDQLRPQFLWAPADVIKKTWEIATRWGRSIEQIPFQKHFKSLFPAFNIPRRREAVATDTVYSDTPAIDNGSQIAQLFVGFRSLFSDVNGMKTDKQFVNTLEDNIWRRGAMDKLLSDRAQVEISNKVKDLLRNLVIDDWQSEPYHEHQNPAER